LAAAEEDCNLENVSNVKYVFSNGNIVVNYNKVQNVLTCKDRY